MGYNFTEKQWAMLCHLGGFASYFFFYSSFLHYSNLLAPFVIWQIKKGESEFIDDQGKEAFNFQISATIVHFGLIWLLHNHKDLYYLYWVINAVTFFLMIQAAIAANKGIRHRYPVNFRFIK
jgi:uncharacterized protein